MYEADVKGDRPSTTPEKLLGALLLEVLDNMRSERQLMELYRAMTAIKFHLSRPSLPARFY